VQAGKPPHRPACTRRWLSPVRLDSAGNGAHTCLMRRLTVLAGALLALALPGTALAQLSIGGRAPDFTAQSALGGKVQSFNLRSALRRGPVVLYFFPKAFTQGCTLETRAFAEASDQFRAAGATVVGLSTDDIPTLQRFSTEECRGKFAVASATPEIVRAYDVAMKRDALPAGAAARMPANLTGRTSYVIAPDGRISFVHSDLDYRDHVRLTLQAVQALRTRR
jgi:thioredoxin-dependent peroxiredoxin